MDNMEQYEQFSDDDEVWIHTFIYLLYGENLKNIWHAII